MSTVIKTIEDVTGLEARAQAYALRIGLVRQEAADFGQKLREFVAHEAREAGVPQAAINVMFRQSRDLANVFGGALDVKDGNTETLAAVYYSESIEQVLSDAKADARLLDRADEIDPVGRVQ